MGRSCGPDNDQRQNRHPAGDLCRTHGHRLWLAQGEETCAPVVHECVRFLLQRRGHEGVGQLLQQHQELPQSTGRNISISPPGCLLELQTTFWAMMAATVYHDLLQSGKPQEEALNTAETVQAVGMGKDQAETLQQLLAMQNRFRLTFGR